MSDIRNKEKLQRRNIRIAQKIKGISLTTLDVSVIMLLMSLTIIKSTICIVVSIATILINIATYVVVSYKYNKLHNQFIDF